MGTGNKLRKTESIWHDADSKAFVAEIRGLFDQNKGYHEWIRLGYYGSREAAMKAILQTREGE